MQGRDFHFSQRDFERVRTLLHRHAGISLSDAKDQLVYSRLARRLRALGLKRFDVYLDGLSPASAEWQEFLNALTTNLTSFFREAHHFDVLRQFTARYDEPTPMRIWCTASSTGEEPYSIAMTVQEGMGDRLPRVHILASDIDTTVLQKAERGVYPLESVARLSKTRLRQCFLRGKGANEGMVKIRPELRQLVTFEQINLLSPGWPVAPGLDIIFCRNVMIYFDKATQKQLVERFVPLLKPGGLLFVGHSENLSSVTQAFELIGKTIYRPRFKEHVHG